MNTGFQQAQRELAAAVRDPSRAAPAGIEARRLQVYRELVHNNVEGFLRSNFPVLHSLLPVAQWRALTQAFLLNHRCHSPYFLEIGREFLGYLQSRDAAPDDPPFLLELAHYEWVELALDIDPTDLDAIDAQPGDLLERRPLLSPLAWPLAYRFPVHRIGAAFQPRAPGDEPTWLLVWRNRADRVEFMALNVVSARLLSLLGEEGDGRCGRALLLQLAAELNHAEPEQVLLFGGELLRQWQAQDVILGTASSRVRHASA